AKDIMFVPAQCDIELEVVALRLQSLLGLQEAVFLDRVRSPVNKGQPYKLIPVKKDVPRSTLARVEEHAHFLPGVITVVRPQRRYLYGKTGGQILGYVNEIDKETLSKNRDRYKLFDLVGRTGLEGKYESLLHGRDGKMLVTQYAAGLPQVRTDAYGMLKVEYDSVGHELVVLDDVVQPTGGGSLYTTLDIGLQAKAEKLLRGEEGAIVVLNAANGEVLALASAPGYDPSAFVTAGMNDERREILNGRPNRMQNRTFQEQYAPGSIFKIAVALAALEEGVIDENSTRFCSGRYRWASGAPGPHCWKRAGHGHLGLVDALAFSCDVFFYNVGLDLGVDRIHEWTTRFGLGAKTGLDLPGEVTGLMPSREARVAVLKIELPDEPWNQKWFPGNTINLSIGQGMATVTPLQGAMLMALITNGGHRIRPHLNRGLTPEVSELALRPEHIALVREGLVKCVEKGPPAPTGTGITAQIDGLTVLGKTGTAQVASLKARDPYTDADRPVPRGLLHHAWFVAGVPDLDPPIAVCVLIEHGESGGAASGPRAKAMIEYFYAGRESAPEVALARSAGTTP
ncbi:MAG: penicillin-binding transpeptidase domain-containing protein, partial [Candidatus Hydrogenedentes bacterium]|nr:penicillin-binding transpeptidase domain-containing protein [Candidatus Hydrogenedentota bacterium]